MKLFQYATILLTLSFVPTLLLAGQDAPYNTQGFTSENQDQNDVYFFNLWQTYTSALKHISEPPPKNLSPDVPFDEKKLMQSRYSYLIQKMLEIRACVHQVKHLTLSEAQIGKIKQMDSYLQKMDLWYPSNDQLVTSAVDKMGDHALHEMVNHLLN